MKEYRRLIFVGLINQDIYRKGEEETTAPGGAVYFAGLAAAKFAEKNQLAIISRVGEDFELKDLQEKIVTMGIKIDKSPTTKSIQIYKDENDLTKREIQFVPGASLKLQPTDIPTNWLKSENFFHIGTMPPQMQQKFVDFLKQQPQKIDFSIDTDVAFCDEENLTIIKKMLKQATLVFLNRLEAQRVEEIMPELEKVVLKLDNEGAIFYQKYREISRVAATKVEKPYPTGAGDILAGSFLASLVLKQKTVAEALKTAVEAASLAVAYEDKRIFFKI